MNIEIDWTKHGKTYSGFNPKGAAAPTHPMMQVPGTGKASWDAELERWTV